MKPLVLTICLAAVAVAPSAARQQMTILEYQPKSSLVVPEHPLTRSKFPFVDVHSHHRRAGRMSAADVDSLIREMDALNMAVMVNLSGGSGEELAEGVANMKGRYPSRFVLFANLSFDNIDDPDYGRKMASQLEADVRNGAQGLKIFKNLGMYVFDGDSNRVPTNDPRLDPVWAKAGELGIPVLIHTGDPHQFWLPKDKTNERWLELELRPGRKRPAEPSWEQIMGEQWDVIRRHPGTTFISAHLSWLGGDLGRLGALLDELPNMNVGIGAVLAELGRQPRFAREWFIKYQDRVLFGKDAWVPEEYYYYFRTLETADEYFDYYRNYHAFWKLYGLDLPDAVLRKLYYENALRIIPGMDASVFVGVR